MPSREPGVPCFQPAAQSQQQAEAAAHAIPCLLLATGYLLLTTPYCCPDAPPWAVGEPDTFRVSNRTSTLRFSARPARVWLSATARLLPKPRIVILYSGIPCCSARYRRTDSARFWVNW